MNMQSADSQLQEYLCALHVLDLEGRASIGSHATAKLTGHLLRRIVQLDEEARRESREPLHRFVDAVSEEAAKSGQCDN